MKKVKPFTHEELAERKNAREKVHSGLETIKKAIDESDWTTFDNTLNEITQNEYVAGATDIIFKFPTLIDRIINEDKKPPVNTIALISMKVMRGVLDKRENRPNQIIGLTKHLNPNESREYLIRCLADKDIYFENDQTICDILKYDNILNLADAQKKFIDRYHAFQDELYNFKWDRNWKFEKGPKSEDLDRFFEAFREAKTLEEMQNCIKKHSQDIKEGLHRPIHIHFDKLSKMLSNLIELDKKLSSEAQVTKEEKFEQELKIEETAPVTESKLNINDESQLEKATITQVVDAFEGKKLFHTNYYVTNWLHNQKAPDRIEFLKECIVNLDKPMTSSDINVIFFDRTVSPEDIKALKHQCEKFNTAMSALERDVIRLEKEINRYKNKHPKQKEYNYPTKITFAIEKAEALKNVLSDVKNQNSFNKISEVLLKASKNPIITRNRPSALADTKLRSGPKWFRTFRGKIDPESNNKSESTTHNHLIDLRKELKNMSNTLTEVKERPKKVRFNLG